MDLLWIVLAVLVVAAGAGYRRRLASLRRRDGGLDDDAIRAIEREGALWRDPEPEPLDLEEIREEEERFWEEEWEEPEEW